MTPEAPRTQVGASAPGWIEGTLALPASDPDRAQGTSPIAMGPFETTATGLFETLKVVEGRAFAPTRHLRRLRRAAEIMGLSVPHDDRTLLAAVAAVLDADGRAGRIRITVAATAPPTIGTHPPADHRASVGELDASVGDHGGSAPGDTTAGSRVIVTAAGATPWTAPARVVLAPWPRNERGASAGLKATSYADNLLALDHAWSRQADEAIFANTRGELCEGTGTNVFLGIGGRLVTPALASGCLAGITRELVTEVVHVEQVTLPVSALAAADEAFLTSSTRDVQPIATVDGIALPRFPGPLTVAAQRAFSALQARTLDP